MWTNNTDWSTKDFYQNETKRESIREAWESSKKRNGKKMRFLSNATYPSLKVYIREILKNSLITSIPEITKSKNWTKKIIKIFVFILCLIGFIYQTLNFLWLYLSYPTVVNVLISNPFEIVMPAVTICNRNRLRRSVVCADEDNQCSFMDEDSYCKTYPRSCPTFRKIFTGVPFVSAMIQNSWYWDEEKEAAHTEKMIQKCSKFIEGEQNSCTKPYHQIPVVTSTGEPNMCYTIESLWEKPDAEPAIYPNTFTLELNILTEPEEYIVYTEPVLIQIAIHDARKLVNPFTEGYSLKGGVQYDATISMTEKKLLPPPYDTNCTDYLKMWKENNGTGPLNDLRKQKIWHPDWTSYTWSFCQTTRSCKSTEMCIEYCKLNTLLERGECIDKNVHYPHTEELCERGVTTTTSDIIENCTKSCGNPCSDYSYEVRYEAVNNYDHICKDEWCRVSKIKVILYFNQFRVTKFQYQPKFESVEMFSYIGGYMGMWLGLSLVSLFDFVETLAYLFYYPIGHLRWKTKKKQTKPVNALKTNLYYGSQIY